VSALELNAPFAVWLLALTLFAADAVGPRRPLSGWAHGLLRLGWLLLGAGLGTRAWAAGRAPMANMHESLLVLAWGAALIYLLYSRRSGLEGLGGWVTALLLLVLGAASLMDPGIRPLMPALQSNWLLYHVVVVMLGYSAFAVAAAAGLLYLVRDRRAVRGDARAWERAGAVEGVIYRACGLGFLLLTGGILLGAVWANEAWGTYWSWDPKETWSLITWFVYAAGLHLWRARGWRGTRFAWFSLIGFGVVLFTYVGVNYWFSGLHSYAGS
jgi:cytochrome c-type biogenesis protein CcsB